MNDEQNILPALQHIALMAGLNHDCKLLTGKQVAANVLQRNGGEHGEAVVIRRLWPRKTPAAVSARNTQQGVDHPSGDHSFTADTAPSLAPLMSSVGLSLASQFSSAMRQ